MLKPGRSPFADRISGVLRIVSGGALLLAGAGKIFGLFGQQALSFKGAEQVYIGGLIEIVGGLAIPLGLFTRCAAFVCSGMMAVAYWQFHVFGPHSPAGYQKF